MEVFEVLETRVEKLIEAYGALQARVRELEAENASLREGSEGTATLQARLTELEAERTAVRERLERVLGNLAALEL